VRIPGRALFPRGPGRRSRVGEASATSSGARVHHRGIYPRLNWLDPLRGIRAALRGGYPGSPKTKIGIVDGLPDLIHPAFRTALIEIVETMVPPDAQGADAHATGICSIIFGNSDAIRGLAPGCSGVVLPIFFHRQSESHLTPASQIDLAHAITFALELDVSIINVSAGQQSSTVETAGHLEQALHRCIERRVLLVAAAGNDGCPCIHVPAAVQSVLAVGAVDVTGRPLETSNWGEPYRQNGLLAPGKDLPVAVPGGGVSAASGTSFATAVVSGVAALLLSFAQRENVRLDALDIRQILIDSAVPCELEGEGACDRYLAGTLDASAALLMLRQIGTTTTHLPISHSPLTPQSVLIGGGVDREVEPLAIGDSEMPNSTPEQKDAAAMEALGLSPSTCECQSNPEDEPGKAAVKPQSSLSMLPSSPTAPLIAQSKISAGVDQLASACAAAQPSYQIVYALGALWFDFGTEARHDALVQRLQHPVPANADNPSDLFRFLGDADNLRWATGLTFILKHDQTPLYAIQPGGPFALATYREMLDALLSSLDSAGSEQRVSIPGYIVGATRLMNGMPVPVIYPDLRGMYKWRSDHLISATRRLVPADQASDDEILNFLNRVYYELRNLGVAPQERAINFAATNAYQARVAFADSTARGHALDSIKVVKSPICRPDSDCWDVQLQMFDPENERRAGRIYRFTVDVSEVLPVTVGPIRQWAARSGAF
jgi:cyanobactin maturation PatA/PatG family protease